jgi:hypothetical protein
MAREIPIAELLRTQGVLRPAKCTYEAWIHEKNVASFVMETRSLGGGQWELFSGYYHHNGAEITSAVKVEGEGLAPLSTHKVHNTQAGRIVLDAQYHDDRVEIIVSKPTGLDNLEIPLSGPIFDNDEILPLLRFVGWKEELETCLEGIIVDSARKYFAWLKALKREKVACGVGSVDTWMVRILFDSGVSQNFWYGVHFPHHLIRYENSHFQLSLANCDE